MATDRTITILDASTAPALKWSASKKAFVSERLAYWGDSDVFTITDHCDGTIYLDYQDSPNGHNGGRRISADAFEAAVRAWLAKR